MLQKLADEMSVAVAVLSGNLFFEKHNGLPARSTEPREPIQTTGLTYR
jgi:hypothetical protein